MRKFDKARFFARNFVPDIPFVRRYLTRRWIKGINNELISEKELDLGEADQDKKAELVKKYSYILDKPSKNLENLIDTAIDSCVRYKNLDPSETELIKTDMRFCNITYGFIPNEYVAFGLENKGLEERKTYVSDQLRRIYRCKMNDIFAANLFVDKEKTYQYYREYYKRNLISISKPSDYGKFQSFINEHSEFVIKNAIDSLGASVRLVKCDDIKDERLFFSDHIHIGKHVLEDRINQSKALSLFNESSVNTIRAVSFQTRNGIVVPYCILRMGSKGSFVDNGGHGGIIACVDYQTGKIISDGYDESGRIYKSHPDTGTVFSGHQLPDWAALKTICSEVALKVSKIKMIGWDFAHSADYGWIIVEGNDSPHLIGQQMIAGGMKSVFEKMLSDMELYG